MANVPWILISFKKFVLKPGFAAGLDHVKASYNSPYGVIKSQWQRQDNQIKCEFEIPQNSTADIVLPGKTLNDVSGRIEAIVG